MRPGNPEEQNRLAEAAASEALALAPNDARAHYAHARALYARRLPERALRECELAISLDRNFSWGHAHAGLVKIAVGRAEETESHVANAIRLSPLDPRLCTRLLISGMADLFLGRFDRAIDQLRKSVELSPNDGINAFLLAAASALAGRLAEAAEACTAGRRAAPNFGIGKYRSEPRSDNSTYLAQRERVYEGMRKAGVPEE
jgi:tetratricopeptide (TPR) repeat protein